MGGGRRKAHIYWYTAARHSLGARRKKGLVGLKGPRITMVPEIFRTCPDDPKTGDAKKFTPNKKMR